MLESIHRCRWFMRDLKISEKDFQAICALFGGRDEKIFN
jgi:hypothetical protein